MQHDLDGVLHVLVERHPSGADLAERGDRRSVVTLDQRQLSTAELARALRGQDHQGKMVGHMLQTLLDRYARHRPSSGVWRLPANGGWLASARATAPKLPAVVSSRRAP